MGTGGPFPGGKARPGRDADHSPPSSAEVKYEQELYLLSPHVPPRRVAGQLHFFTDQGAWFMKAGEREVYICLMNVDKRVNYKLGSRPIEV
jgi:hypothetical protein